MVKTNNPSSILSRDELATLFEFLHWKDILRARVCQNWKEAAALTFVSSEINVRTVNAYKALPFLVEALPNLQKLQMYEPRDDEISQFKLQEGEDPLSMWFSPSSDDTPPPKIDLIIISKFKNLQELNLSNLDALNGTYPFLFQFPCLRKLRIYAGDFLKWDLEMLSGLPMLQDLYVAHNHHLTGNIKSLRVLKNTLQKLTIATCWDVEGDLMELADFKNLEEVLLINTKVTGDIRHIKVGDFQKLTKLDLPDGVYGGRRFNRIQEAPEFMNAVYCLVQRYPTLFDQRRWGLNYESEDWYETNCHHSRAPPFHVEFKKAGKRLGWRWTNCVCGGACEMRWLDPEPDVNNEDYAKYMSDLEDINQRDVGFYRGFLEPPSEEEHRQLCIDIPLDPILTRFTNRNSMFGNFGFW